jgi:hypothetical protein
MKKSINELSSNQYYKGLNNRFDNRCKKLRKLGYIYNKELNIFKPNFCINSSFHIGTAEIMYSDKRHFNRIIQNFN